jgi:hypothetical protein
MRMYYPPDLCEQKRNDSLAVDIPMKGFEYTTCLQFCYSRKQHRVSAENIPKVPGAYIFVIMLADGHRIYGGQSKNLLYRTVHCHLSAKYRKRNRSLAYTYVELSLETFFALPVASLTLTDGPTKNLLEQWLVVMFRCLQVEELIENHSEEAFGLIPEEYLNLGANLAEPSGQGLPLSYFPGRPEDEILDLLLRQAMILSRENTRS